MKKYAIVRVKNSATGKCWYDAHHYNFSFKFFGPHYGTEVHVAISHDSADDAEQKLIKILANNGKEYKHEIVRIVEH